MTTICVQIGNSDDKLGQRQWAAFCTEIREACRKVGVIHFSGGSETSAPWQNYCVVVHIDDISSVIDLEQMIKHFKTTYGQESIAWLEGDNQLI